MNNEIAIEINRKISQIKAIIQEAPRAVGSIAVTHFKGNFRRQSFDGVGWKKRVNNKGRNPGRPIMFKSGTLRDSIRIVRSSTAEIEVGTDVIYAKIHNEGGTINQAPRSETFTRNRHLKGKKKGLFKKGVEYGKQGFTYKARKINIPKRQFIGESVQLNKEVDHWYQSKITPLTNN